MVSMHNVAAFQRLLAGPEYIISQELFAHGLVLAHSSVEVSRKVCKLLRLGCRAGSKHRYPQVGTQLVQNLQAVASLIFYV